MKRLYVISVLFLGLAGRGHGQPITVWIEQLAALQTLQGTIGQGYAVAISGLNPIGVIRNQEFQLHKGYFSSLDAVKPVVANDPRVQALRERLAALKARLQGMLDYWQSQSILSP